MLTVRVIPCLDVRDGRVVKGTRFQNLRDSGDPVELVSRYAEEGADEVTILDVSATLEGRLASLRTIEAVRRAVRLPILVGGGVRAVDDARRLLESGADKVGVNSAAIKCPDLISEISGQFGAQCAVVAVDAKRTPDGWRVLINAGSIQTDVDAIEWAALVQNLGAGEILLTSWDRDGTGEGFDLDLTEAVSSKISLPVIASGGASRPTDFSDAVRAGASAVLAASVFHEGRYTIGEVKRSLRNDGFEVRL
ncbi:MAG TPA: imidazole glycerol phosphate synthase subunit HisF [Fimbriimonadaceae bacterium]|nr:imidazole glycerol phosphate synthase subunit HisF [Fimbriimonadaceae bacterium]